MGVGVGGEDLTGLIRARPPKQLRLRVLLEQQQATFSSATVLAHLGTSASRIFSCRVRKLLEVLLDIIHLVQYLLLQFPVFVHSL